jgi:surfactin synthase thioesterase subunit
MTAPHRDDPARWLRRPHGTSAADVRLFCLHHAGGAASVYRGWPGLMPPWIEPVAVQLPGRADRIREPAFEAMPPLVDALAAVIEPLLEQPYAFYGLSMGAQVAFALTQALRRRGRPMPALLAVASAAAPGWDGPGIDWSGLTDDPQRFLQEMGGTPPEVVSDPELVAFLLPTLRADLAVLDSVRYVPDTPLDVAIHAFAGADDIAGRPERMSGWREQTRARFDLDVVPGGHFFDPAGERRVIRAIADDLVREAVLS